MGKNTEDVATGVLAPPHEGEEDSLKNDSGPIHYLAPNITAGKDVDDITTALKGCNLHSYDKLDYGNLHPSSSSSSFSSSSEKGAEEDEEHGGLVDQLRNLVLREQSETKGDKDLAEIDNVEKARQPLSSVTGKGDESSVAEAAQKINKDGSEPEVSPKKVALVRLERPSLEDNEAADSVCPPLVERGPVGGVPSSYRNNTHVAAGGVRNQESYPTGLVCPPMPANFPNYNLMSGGTSVSDNSNICVVGKRGAEASNFMHDPEPFKYGRPQQTPGAQQQVVSYSNNTQQQQQQQQGDQWLNNLNNPGLTQGVSSVYQTQMSGGTVYQAEEPVQVLQEPELQLDSLNAPDSLGINLALFNNLDDIMKAATNAPVEDDDPTSAFPSMPQAIPCQQQPQMCPLPPVNTLIPGGNNLGHRSSSQSSLQDAVTQDFLQACMVQNSTDSSGKRSSYGSSGDESAYQSDVLSPLTPCSPLSQVGRGAATPQAGTTTWSPPPSVDSGMGSLGSPMSEDGSGLGKSPRHAAGFSPMHIAASPSTISQQQVPSPQGQPKQQLGGQRQQQQQQPQHYHQGFVQPAEPPAYHTNLSHNISPDQPWYDNFQPPAPRQIELQTLSGNNLNCNFAGSSNINGLAKLNPPSFVSSNTGAVIAGSVEQPKPIMKSDTEQSDYVGSHLPDLALALEVVLKDLGEMDARRHNSQSNTRASPPLPDNKAPKPSPPATVAPPPGKLPISQLRPAQSKAQPKWIQQPTGQMLIGVNGVLVPVQVVQPVAQQQRPKYAAIAPKPVPGAVSKGKPAHVTKNGKVSTIQPIPGLVPSVVPETVVVTQSGVSPSTPLVTPGSSPLRDRNVSNGPSVKDSTVNRDAQNQSLGVSDIPSSIAESFNADLLIAARRRLAEKSTDEITEVDKDGDNCLHMATLKDLGPLVVGILERLSREDLLHIVNDQNHAGQTALYIAACTNRWRLVRLLIEYGADVNLMAESKLPSGERERVAAIHCVAGEGEQSVPTLNALLLSPKVEVDLVDSNGHTALFRAIQNHGRVTREGIKVNSIPVIQALLAAEADPNLQVRQSGKTAFMYALESRNIELIEKMFTLVDPAKLSTYMRTKTGDGSTTCQKIAESIRSSLPPESQQILTACLRLAAASGTGTTSSQQ